jgi:hypothetical protein
MAKLKNNLESTISGKIGNVVYVQMDGKTYARAVPNRKKDSWSEKQQLHRKRFRAVNDFCHKILEEPLRKIWNKASPTGRGYPLFVKTNMPIFALDGSMTDIGLLQLTVGKLHLPQALKLERVAGDDLLVEVSWKNDPRLEGERLRDELMAFSSNGRIYSEILATGIHRSTLGGTFQLPELHFPATHLWLFFASEDKEGYSESQCFELGPVMPE